MAKIAIDCGHGRYTAGKRCMKKLDPKQTREWVLNDRVGDSLEKYLESAGHKCLRVDDIDGSTDVSLSRRVKKANEWGADFYMSVHHDSGIGGGKGGGTTVFVYTKAQTKSKKAQQQIYKYAVKRANLKGNRADGTRSANYAVLRNTNMPACLIECGFMDSATDIKYILDPKWSDKMGLGIAEGICVIFGGKVKADAKRSTSFKVQVKSNSLNIRAGAGVDKKKVGKITDNGVYTIVQTKNVKGVLWGKLKSDDGWISLHEDYVKRI